jgi:ADP-dependent NAD(P)H-hydrate dehydratase / NAD(P)H-hydrate epimerase
VRAAYGVEEIRAAEQPLLDALPPGSLMARAATALAARCADLLGGTYGARVVLLVGTGNNGGDALLAGTQLARRGARVDALLVGDRSPDAEPAELRRAGGRLHVAGSALDADLIDAADLVVDGLLGIGASGALRPDAARLADLVRERCARDAAPFVVAVDVPSGVDASTGEVAGTAVGADVTVTFGGLKTGLLVTPGATYAGAVDLVDIGLDLPAPNVVALDADDVAQLLPMPDVDSDKYGRGVVGVVAGSRRYTGAAVLCVGGALHAGAGMIRYAGVDAAADQVRAHWPEALVTTATDPHGVLGVGQVQSWVVGSGLGTGPEATAIVTAVLGTDLPVVLDADAITVVGANAGLLRDRSAPTLLTPHAGEFARLVGAERADVEARRLRSAQEAARRFGATVLLKGSTTVIADPSGRTRINTAQTSYLATAGSGDVLAGTCGTMLAAGLEALDAGAVAAFLHGFAAVLAAGDPPAPITPRDVAAALPGAMRAIRG